MNLRPLDRHYGQRYMSPQIPQLIICFQCGDKVPDTHVIYNRRHYHNECFKVSHESHKEFK